MIKQHIPILYVCLASLLMFSAPVRAQVNGAVIEEMESYLAFSEYGGGVVLPEQLSPEDWSRQLIIDARDEAQYAKGHIPGAMHLEWRQVLAKRNNIPRDRPVLLYCNTGSLSAQAAFALRVAGWDQVRVLQGGLQAWKAKTGLATVGSSSPATAP